MKISVSSYSYQQYIRAGKMTQLDCVARAKDLGFDAIEFIDLDGAGVGDRHVDLFWGAWTLGFNLGTDKYRERFFDAYGRDAIDAEKLTVIAAAEVFG